jgi:crotonobetainyl-CoA:carnitine CoA-transferase CaiB-like acyl-CoA transferase
MSGARPLEGLRVIELGQLLAGPFAGTILGYFGAEVIKVEPPTGDPFANGAKCATACRCGTTRWRETKKA